MGFWNRQKKEAEAEAERDEAARSLAAAERHLPAQVITVYYKGYLAYLRGDTDRAAVWFRRALRVSPEDSWSKYMLAISLSKSGDHVAAKTTLAELAASGADASAREKAQSALAVMAGALTQSRRTWISLQFETGSGLDTNPIFISDSAADETAGLALQGSVALAVTRRLTQRQLLSVGLQGFERAYAVGDNDAAQTEVGMWAVHKLTAATLQAELAASYSFFMFGHEPLLSSVSTSLGCGYRARSWLGLAVIPAVGRRITHADSYQYLSATTLGGVAEALVQWRAVRASVAYGFSREWAAPVEVQLQDGDTNAVTYLTDYTLTEHGPRLSVDLRLPLSLGLSFAAGLQWRAFDDPDQLTAAGSTEAWSRKDVRVVASAELRRSLGHGFDLGIRFESLDNLSTLDETAPVDRNYSRRILGLVARWKGAL